MSKQEKLISADKIIDYIKNRERSGGDSEELYLLEMQIEAGTFNPETAVPTIKPGDKVFKPGYGSGVVIQEGEHLYKFTDRKWVLFEGDEVPVHIRTSDLEVVKDE